MNVLTWLNSYVQNECELSSKAKSRIRDLEQYCVVVARRENKFIRETDFSIALDYVFPEELLKYTMKQGKEIVKLAETFEDYQEFCVHLQFLAKILADYEQANNLENPIALAVYGAYETLKMCLQYRFPKIYAEYQKRMAISKEKLKSKQDRPPCVECGSKDIVSNGIKTWLCKTCGRQFRKKRRMPSS